MDNESQLSSSYSFDMSVPVSYSTILSDGSISKTIETRLTIEAEQITALAQLLFPNDSLFPVVPEKIVIEVKDERLKDAIPVLYDAVLRNLLEEVKNSALGDKVCSFELMINKDELREKCFTILYMTEMCMIGRRAEQNRRDREQLKSEH